MRRLDAAKAGAALLFVVYLLTLAPDVTFWDAGEFIAAAHVFGQGWPAFRPHLLTGLTFGALFVLTGSLAAAIAEHATYNLFVVAADHGLRNARRGDANLQGLSPC